MNWAEIAWFTRAEFDCGCGCKFNNVTPELAKLLDSARKQLGAPVSSQADHDAIHTTKWLEEHP